MISYLLSLIPSVKKWHEKENKNILGLIIDSIFLDNAFQMIIALSIAVVFGGFSNFAYDEELMVSISFWGGWVPVFVIILPYILGAVIIAPIKMIINKIKKK